VIMLQQRLRLSQRRACQIASEHGSTQCYRPAELDAGGIRARGCASHPPRLSGCAPSAQVRCGRWNIRSTSPRPGARSKILHVVDEFTRESLADLVVHAIDADADADATVAVAVLANIFHRARLPGVLPLRQWS
jgi:hypothetical protein